MREDKVYLLTAAGREGENLRKTGILEINASLTEDYRCQKALKKLNEKKEEKKGIFEQNGFSRSELADMAHVGY